MADDQHEDPGSAGWDAINAALLPLYAGQAPRHFGTVISHTLGGNDPLDGISVYWNESPRPHWHYITYGFSELYGKQSDDLQDSGYGFELTFRLAAAAGQGAADAPPMWPLNLLQNLARYVFGSGNVFEEGHHLDANGPIALETDTLLRHLAFVTDPQLGEIDTPNGHLRFLQVVGLGDQEMAAVKRWSTLGVLKVLEPAMPLWVTDLQRGSLLEDAALAEQVEAGSRRGRVHHRHAVRGNAGLVGGRRGGTLVLGAAQVPSVLELLPLRLRHGKPLSILGRDRQWWFMPGEACGVEIEADSARCTLDEATLQLMLATVRAERGRYPLDGAGLVVEVRPTLLRDGKGDVIRQIG